MQTYVLVFIGGGAGSICRFLIAQGLAQQSQIYPWGTFVANAVSCAVLGILVGLQYHNLVSAPNRLLFMTGFCGGFSTFSTFTGETFKLFQMGHLHAALLYVAASLLVGLLSLYFGIRLGSSII